MMAEKIRRPVQSTLRFDKASGGKPHFLSRRAICKQLFNGTGKRIKITLWRQDACDAVPDDIGNAANIPRDHRQTASFRFQEGHAIGFAMGRPNIEIGKAIPGGKLPRRKRSKVNGLFPENPEKS